MTASAPRSVAVFGSCITRDNFNSRFNPEHRRWYSVVAQANQSSVIALMSPPVEPEVTEADGLSAYDAWNVRSDLSRSFLTELVETQPDYLLLDFFGDLHFGVLLLPDGRFVTDNRWKLHRTAQYSRWIAAGGTEVITPRGEPERHFALWTEAMDRFAAFVVEHCPRTTVVVHRGFYTDRTVLGPTGMPDDVRKYSRLGHLRVGRSNKYWARLDDHAVSTYGWEQIDLRPERYTSTAEHPWGAFWVHYTLDYYPRFLAELHLLDLARRTAPDVAARIALVGDAGRERVRNQARFTRRAVAAQNRRVAALEGRGVVATVRSVARRRR